MRLLFACMRDCGIILRCASPTRRVTWTIFRATRELVTPGDKVVLKPNLVKEGHLFAPNEWEQVITHPVIVECALREVLEALQGEGEVVVADAPQADADWHARSCGALGLTPWHRNWGKNTGSR